MKSVEEDTITTPKVNPKDGAQGGGPTELQQQRH